MLSDGSMRAILLVSAINMGLKSIEEQQAIILRFQDFLNSLDFSLQIVVQSRRLDIRTYLASLEAQETNQSESLMKVQIREYVKFIKKFTDENEIMRKYFFVVVPYTPSTLSSSKTNSLLPSFLNRSQTQTPSAAEAFEEKVSQLEQRLEVVKSGLGAMGITATHLGQNNPDVIVELFYNLFNPGDLTQKVHTEALSK